MGTGYTIFLTYQFEDSPASASTTYGYSKPIHCNYIQRITTDDIRGKALNMYFPFVNEFGFLADDESFNPPIIFNFNSIKNLNGAGFTATRLNAIIQVVNGISDSTTTIKPSPESWFKVDLTDQLNNGLLTNGVIESGYTSGGAISRSVLSNTLFNIEFNTLNVPYRLDYLNYPSNVSDENEMGFGEEVFFFGSIKTDIKASVYTTDIPIVLPLNNYNSTTNPTWDGISTVAISEIGIYDDNNNLVGIGKLNYPINKNSTISRTILFQIDF